MDTRSPELNLCPFEHVIEKDGIDSQLDMVLLLIEISVRTDNKLTTHEQSIEMLIPGLCVVRRIWATFWSIQGLIYNVYMYNKMKQYGTFDFLID
jgi:hypothetical protein